MTPYFVGGQVDLIPKFSSETVWSKLLDERNKINMFIGVPTVFSQLIEFAAARGRLKSDVKEILKRKLRIIGSGSAPLNVKTYNDWFELTGNKILERYGMTEVGMALTNPFVETENSQRIAGTVGRPVGDIQVRLVDEADSKVQVVSDASGDRLFGQSLKGYDKVEIFGELQIKGPIVFSEYLNKPEQSRQSFTEDGWFKTGSAFSNHILMRMS